MKNLFKLMLPHRATILGAMLALVVSAVFTAGLTATTKPLLENILTDQPAVEQQDRPESRGDKVFAYQEKIMDGIKGWFEKQGLSMEQLGMGEEGLNLNNPLPWASLVLLLFLGQAIFDFFGTYSMGKVGIRIVTSLRQRLMDKSMVLPMSAFKKFNTGEFLSRMNNDVGRIQVAISLKVGEVLKEGAVATAALLFLFVISWQLSLVLFILVPMVALPIVYFSRKIRKNAQKSQVFLGAMSGHLKEVLVGMRIVKAFGKESYESQRLRDENTRFLKYATRELRHVALTTPVMGLVGMLIIVGFVSFGSFLIQTTDMTMGDFMVFVLFVYQLYQPIKRIARANSEIQQAVGVLPRIEEILDMENEAPDPDQPERPAFFPDIHKVQFKEICFEYDRNEPVLDHISFEVDKGQVVALVGPSGGGKSTLVNLLPRFFEVTSGSIEFDGLDIRRMTRKDLRQSMAIVTQDTILFNDSVAQNIAYGLKDKSIDEIVDAAQKANAWNFIQELPEGLETRLGEAGARLSGGQKQRISIARAILRNAPLLILDEATSALDTESEQMVQAALENLMQNKTAIVIAHRLSTIRQADHIIFLDKGRIMEAGNHDALMEKDGYYSRWVQIQEGK